MAAHFVASLEMCRDGELEISQEQVFGPIMLRSPQKRRDPELEITSGDYSDMDKLGAKSGAGMDNNGD